MGFFGNLFKQKKNYFNAKIFYSTEVHGNFIRQSLLHNEIIVIVFFRETHDRLVQLLNSEPDSARIIYADRVINGSEDAKIRTFLSTPGRAVVLGERYPMITHEESLASKLEEMGLTLPIDAYCSLDDVILQPFSIQNTKGMMKRLGINENEIIQHQMIERSIERVQEKITKQVVVESKTVSVEKWMLLNYPNK